MFPKWLVRFFDGVNTFRTVEEVLYVEALTLGAHEYARQEYELNDGLVYTMIVVGRGTFDSERGSKCIPAS